MHGGEGTSDKKGLPYRLRRLFRLKISTKIFVYFLCIALIPFLTIGIPLTIIAKEEMLKNTAAKQQAVATDLARRVDNYLAGKINMLVYIGRLYSTHEFTSQQMDANLAQLFNQDSTLEQVSLMSPNGDVGNGHTLKMQDGKLTKTDDVRSLGPEVLNVLAGKSYFVSVGRDANNRPQISIGTLILKKYNPATDGLFAAQSGPKENLAGALIGYFNISDLWKSVLSTKIGDGGYAYVVDNVGNLVAHPDKKFLNAHTQIKDTQVVRQFLANSSETQQTVSETNQDVISTPRKTLTNWAVVVEEPVDSIYSSINSYIQLAAILGISMIILTICVGVFFSRQLIRPIKTLSLGAKRMARGEFDQEIAVKTKDEMQELADTFNSMAMSINKLINDLRSNNLQLKLEQIKLNNIINSVSDGVIAVDADGRIISVNPPAALLINDNPSTLAGKLMTDVYPFQHDGESFTPDLANGGIYRYSDLTLPHDDSVAYVDIMVAVLDHKNSDIAAIITLHDQTASRELNFMKLDFVAIAAHELRTPLTVVRGYLDMLNTGTAVKELSVFNLENLSKAIDGADQLRALINKLLNIARIERGDMEIFIEKLNFTKLVSENVNQHKSIAAQKEQIITYSANTSSTVYVPADTASIVEVLNNLIGNALKYTGKGGKIKVNLITDKDSVRVEVVDNGPGIPEELRDRLFTKFYRAERSLIAGTRGTGLGLYISKTIIELQNGTIGIEPDKGKGSTFYFTLPIYDPVRDDEQIAKNTSGGIRGWFKKRPTR